MLEFHSGILSYRTGKKCDFNVFYDLRLYRRPHQRLTTFRSRQLFRLEFFIFITVRLASNYKTGREYASPGKLGVARTSKTPFPAFLIVIYLWLEEPKQNTFQWKTNHFPVYILLKVYISCRYNLGLGIALFKTVQPTFNFSWY